MQIHSYTHEQGRKATETVTKLEVLEIPKPEKRNSGRDLELKAGSWKRILYNLFYNNEIAKFEDKLTGIQIKRLLINKLTDRAKIVDKHFKSYKYSISLERNKYNQGNLYSAQPPTFLMSLPYGEDFYPIIGGHNHHFYTKYIYFEEVVERCKKFKIADPRFFEYEIIVEIRNRQIQGDKEWLKWVVPNDKQIKDLELRLPIDQPIYNSVKFAPGFTHADTPADFEPFKDICVKY